MGKIAHNLYPVPQLSVLSISSPAMSTPDFLVVRQFPLLQIPVTPDNADSNLSPARMGASMSSNLRVSSDQFQPLYHVSK